MGYLSKSKSLLALLIGTLVVIFLSQHSAGLPEWRKLTGIEITDLEEDDHPDQLPYSDVIFFDTNRGVTITAGSILRSEDGGRSWSLVATRGYLFYALILWRGQPYIAGKDDKDSPVILTSNDYGESWNEIEIADVSQPNTGKKFSAFYDICFDSDLRGWIVGTHGAIEFSFDNERPELESVFGTEGPLYNVSCSGNGTAWANSTTTLFRYRDVWEVVELDIPGSGFTELSKVASNDAGVWVFGSHRSSENEFIDNIVLRSLDDGISWANLSSQIDRPVKDIYIRDRTGWLVGSEGSIYYTRNMGESWQKMPSPTKNTLYSVFFLDQKFGWISGANMTILHSGNGN